MRDRDTGFKAIPIRTLQSILEDLPDDILLSAQTMGHTGNLTVYRGVWPDEEYYGYIDFWDESFHGIKYY